MDGAENACDKGANISGYENVRLLALFSAVTFAGRDSVTFLRSPARRLGEHSMNFEALDCDRCGLPKIWPFLALLKKTSDLGG